MRVTENIIISSYLNSINSTRERLTKLQTQLGTGKRILKPSDNPQTAELIMRYNNALARNEQFQRNIIDARGMMETTSHALESFSELMIELKEIVSRVNSGGQTDIMQTYAGRIDHLIGEAVQIGNTQFNGKYIFGGTQTLTAPFGLAPDRSTVTANPAGITGSIEYPVGEGLNLRVNLDGQEVFLGTQIFQTMIQLRDALAAGTLPTQAEADAVSSQLDHVLAKVGKAGSTLQALERNAELLYEQNVKLQSLLSVEQDTDVAEAALRLRREEIMLETALNAAARIIPRSLLDFLK